MQEFKTHNGKKLKSDFDLNLLSKLKNGITYNKNSKSTLVEVSGLLTSDEAKKLTPLQLLCIIGDGDYSFMSELVINDDYSFSGKYFID